MMCCRAAELRKNVGAFHHITQVLAQDFIHVIGWSVASLRHLWLSSSVLTEAKKVPLLDAPVILKALFGPVVTEAIARFNWLNEERPTLQKHLPLTLEVRCQDRHAWAKNQSIESPEAFLICSGRMLYRRSSRIDRSPLLCQTLLVPTQEWVWPPQSQSTLPTMLHKHSPCPLPQSWH